MKTTQVAFATNEQHMLYGLMAFMYAKSQDVPDKGAAWVIIGRKTRLFDSHYSEDEIELLKLAVEATLAAGEKALDKLPLDNVAARVKAGLVKSTYQAMQEKLNNVSWKNEHDQDAQNLRGNDEGRQVPQGDDLHGTGRREGAPSSGDGSSEGA
jgi:hypothetical protein